MRKRARTGLALAAVVVLLLLLAIGINGLQMLPGRPFDLGSPGAPPSGGNAVSGSNSDFALFIVRALFLAAAVILPLALIYMALSPEGRRQLMAYGIMAVGLVLIFMLLSNQNRKPGDESQTSGPAAQATTPPVATRAPSDVFSGTAPDWLATAISIALALLICGIAGAAFYLAWRRSHQPKSALEELAGEARQAISALQAGGELKDTVLRCYREMSRVLQQERGIQRQAAMTAREFEDALLAIGMPGEPVRQLTRLFEQARYGHERAGAQEEKLAVDSLSAIVAACHVADKTAGGARARA
ncbi:MAG: DUF4129 domain-containing protein [Chloroflexi bacterium]|nr:DUF4129 domain-containing protein [Chloroflexota bacterium]MCL5273640.1 DUF4129 domain-containing protein [Chloroflexota bacterium]